MAPEQRIGPGDHEESTMPKMKTRRGAAKRFRITRKGKIIKRKANRNHLATKKARKRKRRLREPNEVAGVDSGRLRRLLPYS